MGLLLLNDDLTVVPPLIPLDFLGINQARRLVYQHWNDNWTGPTCVFDNMQGVEGTVDSPWVTNIVRELASRQATLGSIGSRRWERQAVLITTIRVPSDEGTELADSYAQAVRDLFEGVTLEGGLNIFQVDIAEGGTDGHWYTVTVRSLFTYQETK